LRFLFEDLREFTDSSLIPPTLRVGGIASFAFGEIIADLHLTAQVESFGKAETSQVPKLSLSLCFF
jgi:hypothetical protein